jgi:hypothetical protein
MKAAEKEIEHIMKKVQDGSIITECGKDGNMMYTGTDNASSRKFSLPSFREMQEARRRQVKGDIEAERKTLEGKVEEIENQIEEIQNRLKLLQKCGDELSGGDTRINPHDFPDELLPDLANLVARNGDLSAMSIANMFIADYGQSVSKKIICSKIEDIANKERRKEEGDLRAVWHILPEYMNLLTVETIRYLRKEKESRLEKKRESKDKKQKNENEVVAEDKTLNMTGATGPDGDFVEFPDYDGVDEPRECKKAFTLFCTATRRDVKKSLDPVSRKDKVRIHASL